MTETFQSLDPATGELLAEIPITSAAELETKVARARAAQEAWAALDVEERCARIASAGPRILERLDEFSAMVTAEMGKPPAQARGEVKGRAQGLERLVDTARAACAVELDHSGGCESEILRDPLGVVAAITPWNFPVGMPFSILLPALAMGNTVVFKPSEHVPLTGALIAEELGRELPEGVLELAQGPGRVGADLVAADVDMIGFVGSRATGQRIMKSAGDGLKRLVLELGGKDPLVVFADADLDAAADCAVSNSLRNTGQVCCSIERVYVADEVAEAFEGKVMERARAWKHGDGRASQVDMGPMVSDEQRRKVHAQVRDAAEKGSRLLLGGELPDGPGYYYPATVLADLAQQAEMAREETFGPVVSLQRFDGSDAEAVRLANDTPYGLGANVYTGDPERGRRVARGIKSGQVGVNRYLAGSAKAPWVGARQSGFGFLGGVEGYRQFSVPKTISVQVG